MAKTTAASPQPNNPYAPLTDEQIQALADQRAASAQAAEQAAILRARQQAAAQALADRQAIQGLGQAAAGILGGVGPGIQSGYDTGARAISDIAGGFSAAQAARTRAAEAASRQFVQSHAPGSAPSGAPDPSAMQDVSYGLGGFIPAGALETQGAAANRWGQVLPAIGEMQTQQDYLKRMAEGSKEDAAYRQQLIDLAAKRPELRNQILDELHTQEMNKLNARIAQQDLSLRKRSQKLAEKTAKQNVAIRARAEKLYEAQFGEKRAYDAAKISIQNQNLTLKAAKQRADLNKAIKDGEKPNASLSRAYGYIVDANGNPIVDSQGNHIPVKESASSKSGSSGYGKAVRAARSTSMLGTPVTVSKPALYRGKYVAKPGAKGVFPDGSTNDPSRARHSGGMTFADAVNYLAGAYGLTRAQARAALIDAGWKPDGERPSGYGKKRG